MWKDPIVEEIHQIRLKIESDNQNDFEKIFSQAIKFQKEFANKRVSKSSLKKKRVFSTSKANVKSRLR